MAVDFVELAVQMTTVGEIAAAASAWAAVPALLPEQSEIDDLVDEAAALVADLEALRDGEEGLIRADIAACIDMATAAHTAIAAL